MNLVELEAAVARRLQQLPSPRAPGTLLPRVLAAAQVWGRRPWYARQWVTWPAGWQVASMIALVVLVAVAAMWLPVAQASVAGEARAWCGEAASPVLSAVQRLTLAVSAGRVVSRILLEPLAAYVLVVAAVMWVACVVVATVLTRVVPREVLQR